MVCKKKRYNQVTRKCIAIRIIFFENTDCIKRLYFLNDCSYRKYIRKTDSVIYRIRREKSIWRGRKSEEISGIFPLHLMCILCIDFFFI